MTNRKLKFEDFGTEKLSKNQQKTVRGGDEVTCPPPPVVVAAVDPGKDGSIGHS
jgi:hypothetical protein